MENGIENYDLSEKTKKELTQILDFSKGYLSTPYENEVYEQTRIMDDINKTHWSVLKGVDFDKLRVK